LLKSAFTQAFRDSLKKYRDELDKLAPGWARVSFAAGRSRAEFSASEIATRKMSEGMAEIAKHAITLHLVTTKTSHMWQQMHRSTAGVASNIKNMTESLLKWSAGIAGMGLGLVASGVYGMMRLGENTTSFHEVLSCLISLTMTWRLCRPATWPAEAVVRWGRKLANRPAGVGIGDYIKQESMEEIARSMCRRSSKKP
jgi:hypothetical protein